MRISPRVKRVPPSPIRKLVPLAEMAKERGIKVYHLNIGQPDIPSPPQMLAALARYPEKTIAYGHSQGEKALRRAFAKYYHRVGIRLSEEEILVTTGGSEALLFALSIAASAGDEVIVFEPFYTNYNGISAQQNIRLIPIATNVKDGYRPPKAKALQQAITSKTRAILVCSPNNPTGTVITEEEFMEIAEVCRQHNLYLLSDEVYREFSYEGSVFSAMNIPDFNENVILLDSISKRFSSCGARIGCIASRNQEVMAAALRLGQARLCPPVIEQFITLSAMELEPNEYIVPSINEYRRRRDLTHRLLMEIPGAFAQKPAGSFYISARLPIDDAEKFCAWLLNDFATKDKETVMLAPLSGFYATPDMGKDEVRIAYVLCEEDLRRAMTALREAVERYNS
jgi:aspartate aminotransferase